MPVSTIIQKQDIIKYKKIFHFLWGVKRIEYSLTSIWRKTRSYSDILSNLKGFTKDIQRSHLLTNEMIHFMTNFHYYVMFEVIECSWEKLCKQVNEATDLDQLIEAHSKFLYEIGTKTFLTNSETCYDSFKKVLSIITKFTTLQTNVCILAHAIKKEQILTDSHYVKINRELTNYKTQLNSIANDYKHYFDLFEKELSKLKIHQDVNPISLLYMLDFNEYYSNTNQDDE
ncbi:spindle pole body component 98 [Cavenderia fasciculata]|uniref:Spindle pole body component 98 n=1 Tax=Cavenderia fasciculata TaxID=261658 RepID=F4Q398_CACFS|nr:spindle pole body component 98 [Cavenderia fasciculata]EGG17608.1 spindle pole body component 98 [Cavenderia fasciculata]|eukprot:XP_004356092.1 spindle pole body component 98 [Cavenderia fasciculata]